jgi:hypothetical protein
MDKYKELIRLLESIFGKSAVSKSLGTRTNVVRLPRGKQGLDPTIRHFDVEGTAQKNSDLVKTIQNSIEDRMGDISKMNDQELLTYTENVRRLASHRNPPMADVVAASNKQQVTGEGLEKLIKEKGLVAPPNTPLGEIQWRNKRAEQEMKGITKEFDLDNFLKGVGKDQLSWSKMHNEGLVRAVTRQILSEDIKAGKIKGLTLEDLGTSREPIDYFRKIYGENALEQLDSLTPEFNRLNTEQEAAKLARTKFKFEPDETRLKGSTSYEKLEEAKTSKEEKSFFEKLFGPKEPEKKAEVLNIKEEATKRKTVDELIEEHNRNSERMGLRDEEGGSAITYQEFQDLSKRQAELENIIEGYGIKPTEETKPEGIVIPFRKKKLDPEEKANGGPIGLDYLMGFDNRPKYASGGDVKKILDLIAKANKELKGKKSMEGVNPKTGEVTSPKQPVMTADDLKTKHKDAFNAHDQIRVDIGDKIAPDMIAESMAEMKGKDYFSLSQREQLDYYKKALAYVDDVRMTKRQNKPIEGGFSFNDPDIKAQMEKAMQEGNKRSKEMRAMGLDPAKSKDYDEYIKIKETSGDKDFNKYFDDLEIKTKFKGVISDDLLNQILIDDNPQRKAEVIATIEQGLTMQEKGMSPEQIVDILKNTTRTKQADGGIAGLL